MGGDGRVERGWDGPGVEGGGPQVDHYPPLHLSLSITAGIFLMSRDAPSPLAEGRLGFPLERREILASLGKEKAGSMWEGWFTTVSVLGMAPHCL